MEVANAQEFFEVYKGVLLEYSVSYCPTVIQGQIFGGNGGGGGKNLREVRWCSSAPWNVRT